MRHQLQKPLLCAVGAAFPWHRHSTERSDPFRRADLRHHRRPRSPDRHREDPAQGAGAMTARDDQQKYDYICELVDKTYPILAPVWQAARTRFGAAWLREFIENIEVVYGKVDVGIEGRLGDALDGYAEFVNDSLRNQSFYEKHRRYKASSYAECVDAYYHNADHMIRCYLPGMYLSHLLWPQHYNMLCGFRENMLRRLEQPKLFFEVGVGCGMYSKVLLERFPRKRGIGIQIRPFAVQ